MHKDGESNRAVTRQIAWDLVEKGFMIDYADGNERGAVLRPVISRSTGKEILDILIKAVLEIVERCERAK